MNTLFQDLRHSVRIFLKSRGISAVLVLTLALGIGANTAIFSIVNAVLIEPLPFPEPSRLVAVFQTMPQQDIFDAGASYPNLVDWQAQSQEMEEISALRNHTFTLVGSGEATYVTGASVTSNIFASLKVGPLLGRALNAADDELSAPPVALIGEDLWRNRFNAERSVIGRSINLDNKSYTIIGVMPRIFRFPYGTVAPQMWIPLSKEDIFRDLMGRRKGHYLQIVGRLKPGVSLKQAQADLSVIASRMGEKYPEANAGWGIRIEPLQDRLVGNVRTPLMLLWAAVGLVLVIASLNIANLLLGQATARVKEFTVRVALGATRGRLIRQLLTEYVLLGVVGGALGVLLAYLCVTFTSANLPPEIPRIHEIRLDGLVLLFTTLLSIGVSILIGLVPALSLSVANLQSALQEGGRSSGTGKARLQTRSLMVACEIVVSMVLLVAAGLVLRSFQRLQNVELGFEPQNVIIANIALPREHYTSTQQWVSFYDQVVQHMNTTPGIPEAAVAVPVPPFGAGFNFRFAIQGRAPQLPGQEFTANYSAVSADYFKLLRVPLVRGRLFSLEDRPDTVKVCLISDKFARVYFPNEDPIGKQLTFGYLEEVPRTIVGIVGDVKQVGLASPFAPQMYAPYTQNPWSSMGVLVRTSVSPESFLSVLGRKVHEIDAQLPVADVAPMPEAISESIAQPRFRSMLFGLFGLMALVLAAVGVYGVISYFVTQRTREIGVRMALGAQQGDVLKLIVWQGFRPAIAGVIVGLFLALALGKTIGSLLYGISATDTLTFCAAGGLLLLVALAASYIPAHRAMRIDPTTALRQE